MTLELNIFISSQQFLIHNSKNGAIFVISMNEKKIFHLLIWTGTNVSRLC